MNFGQFYQDGGVFMHVITLLSIFTAAGLLHRCGAIRGGSRGPRERLVKLSRTGAVAPSMLAAIVMVGLLGTSLGWVSVNAALPSIDPEHWDIASARGYKIVPYPLVWSLICAAPLTLAHGLLRHFEQRLRGLVEAYGA
ncbi:MAG: hypothetical protein AAF799_14160 [Myxococcota bacterium]